MATKSLRFRKTDDGLLAWYEQHAEEIGRSVNAALLTGLQAYRAAQEAKKTTHPREDAPA